MGSQYDEKDLLIQLLQGNEKAFEEIYNHYSKRLYGNLLKLVKSEADAKEILQDVFLKIWDNRKKIDIEKSFRSFLFKITENNVNDFFRKAARDKKRKIRLIALASKEYMHIEEILLTKENAAILQKAIASLTTQRQLVFRLCKLEGKSYKEVSKLLGISVSTISDHIVKATKAIRSYLENKGHGFLALFAIIFRQLL